jgi:lipid-binding SYLF domain-containing protein
MKKILLLAAMTLLLAPLSACLAPQGSSPEQKRSAIMRMHDETLERLYEQRATARDVIDRSAGYAVFSNINAQYLILGGGGGFGVAVDRATGTRTFMKMAQVGVGLGLGVQDIRVVFVFHSERALNNFISNGWEFGGQADAAAKARDRGAAATGELSTDAETSIYTMSEAGLMAKVNLAGTKYWRSVKLND